MASSTTIIFSFITARAVGSSRWMRWNKRVRIAYLDVAKVVYFANSDIGLIRGTGDTRRRFLDFVGSQLFKNYREILRSYEKALHSRNRYLKMIPARPREVKAYSKPLLQFGHQLTALRGFLVERLEPYVIESFGAISDLNETLRLCYQPGATADFEKALRESEGGGVAAQDDRRRPASR